MSILVPWPTDEEWKCCFCDRGHKKGEDFVGPNMWHKHIFTCRHTRLFECPECYRQEDRYAECPQCGCGEEYT